MVVYRQSGVIFISANDIQIYLGFLFNIYTKIKYEDETFENTKTIERRTRKLEYI